MELRIYNEFGITPTNTYQSAGMDFYLPNINPILSQKVYAAFRKSYKLSLENFETILNAFRVHYGDIVDPNIIHLYLALDSFNINIENTLESKINKFINDYLITTKDDEGNVIYGLQLQNEDKILINSGIKVALDPGTAGIFFNKSGKGNAGFDVRAQVVDEDYTGFVHLSLQYCVKNTSATANRGRVYCGDKLTQMVILPVLHMNPVEISQNEYDEIMADSKRGDGAFGHNDIKH